MSESEAFKFIDDASFIEVHNIASVGLSSPNCKLQVPSDLSSDKLYLSKQNTQSQGILDKISQWTNEKEMKINAEKNKCMIINFCNSTQFNTRLYIEKSIIEQVQEVKFLGVTL